MQQFEESISLWFDSLCLSPPSLSLSLFPLTTSTCRSLGRLNSSLVENPCFKMFLLLSLSFRCLFFSRPTETRGGLGWGGVRGLEEERGESNLYIALGAGVLLVLQRRPRERLVFQWGPGGFLLFQWGPRGFLLFQWGPGGFLVFHWRIWRISLVSMRAQRTSRVSVEGLEDFCCFNEGPEDF